MCSSVGLGNGSATTDLVTGLPPATHPPAGGLSAHQRAETPGLSARYWVRLQSRGPHHEAATLTHEGAVRLPPRLTFRSPVSSNPEGLRRPAGIAARARRPPRSAAAPRRRRSRRRRARPVARGPRPGRRPGAATARSRNVQAAAHQPETVTRRGGSSSRQLPGQAGDTRRGRRHEEATGPQGHDVVVGQRAGG